MESRMDPYAYSDYLKNTGNDFYKAGRYIQAVEVYEHAIHVLADTAVCSNVEKEMAVLWNNRANALFKLQRWKDAFSSANISINVCPFYTKAYYRSGLSALKLNDVSMALSILVTGLQMLDRKLESKAIVDFLYGIFLSLEVAGRSSSFIITFDNVLREQYPKQIWQPLIVRLIKENMYQSCILLMKRRNKLPAYINDLKVPLGGIFKTFVSSAPCQDICLISELVTWLITMGADVETIGEHPLHSVIQLCIKTANNSLFKLVVKMNPDMKKCINKQDRDGNTVLHLVASIPANSHGYTVKCQTQDVKMLLDFGMDPCIINQLGRDAASLLKQNKNFKAEDIIKKHLASLHPTAVPSASLTEVCSFAEDKTDLLACALGQFVDFCKQKHKVKKLCVHKPVRNFLHILSSLKELPSNIRCDIPDSVAERLITQLTQEQRWQEILLLLTRDANGESEQEGLIQRCSLPNINIFQVINNLDPKMMFRLPLIKLFLGQRVSPNGIGANSQHPIQVCLKKSDFALAYILLSSGGDPTSISIKVGDTPLHAAVSIALNNKDDNGVSMAKYLLDLYSSEPQKYCYLEPNIQDQHGDTVMHLVFQSNNAKQYRKIMDVLAKYDLKLTIQNNEGKNAKHRIKKNDPHNIAWEESRQKYKQHQPSCVSKSNKAVTNGNITHRKTNAKAYFIAESVVADDRKTQVKEDEPPDQTAVNTKKIMSTKESISQIIMKLIMKCTEPNKAQPLFDSLRSQTIVQTNNADTNELPVVYDNEVTENLNPLSNGCLMENNECAPNGFTVPDNIEDDVEPLEDIDLSRIDFNNMTWEVECSPEVLKKLGCKSVAQYMKKKIIVSIQKLGNGEWTRSLRKQLKLNSNIKLYEVKLDKGARMLWELAIDFSPRCSEEPEKILSELSSVKTGKVYTEIIRIWDIVFDHCKLNHAIQSICTAYDRGLNCILRKKLKGITKITVPSNSQKRIPQYFMEDIDFEFNMEHIVPDYFPPASIADTEYNIMKFHSFSTDMALNVLSNMNSRVEYPFRVGEMEYAVIDLNPKPMEAIILIGRSGTGKTTCCFYRLWKKFHSYWAQAATIGPWLVKQTWKRRKYSENIDIGDSGDDEDSETELSDNTDEEQTSTEAECTDAEIKATDNDMENLAEYEHYHPVFITKNQVLCQEVQRNFIELSKSTKATCNYKPVEPNVYRLQDIQDESYPLFITSQQLLILLDASMPDPFFPRNEDGSLKRNISGWSSLDNIDVLDLLNEDYEFEPEPENEEEENDGEQKESDPRVFVTFEVFARALWPKMVKGKSLYNAALVWKEIKSFLKGSFEALSCCKGKLTEEEYIKLGKKRAPNFQGDRKEIYRLFCLYEQMKTQFGYFDEEDVLYNLSCRLSTLDEFPWSIHELYGDEIQDFTQAELFLLMRCINDPNSMFLTGDTAQSIMKGVSFRFSDLRSLFYYANKYCSGSKKNCIVRKPKQVYKLIQNYRSHSGILHLASGVVDLLQYFFPESFDRLPRDSGLFDGPKPTVLDSCCVSDLAILLRGNKRKTQPIEFGAHQVILVVNEKAKENIPEELSLALVLTIYEAKGLEFDDVLLYNFFTDSEASKEWKIISSFNPVTVKKQGNQPLIEVPFESTCNAAHRPFDLDPEMHKMLNGEMKQLYTAITRARVNLWIFDENHEKRAPAFEYFMKGSFVQVVQTDKNNDLDDNMFVKTSSKEEWIARGDYYASHQCWKVAAKCYQKGGAVEKEKVSFANGEVLSLQTRKANAKVKPLEYLQLAKTYLECQEPKLALKCLMKAKEFKLCAELCKQMKKTKDAAIFCKKAQDNKAAAQLFEQAGEVELALNLYYHEKMYEEAAETIERYRQKHPNIQLPFRERQFYLEAAADYFKQKKLRKMKEMLLKLDVDDQLVFLKNRKCWIEAADLLKNKNRSEEAAALLREHGMLLEAADLTTCKKFRAICLLAAARHSMTNANDNDPGKVLSDALQLLGETNQNAEAAEAMLLQGVLERDLKKIKRSFFNFKNSCHHAGVVEALYQASVCDESNSLMVTLASDGLESLITLIKALKETKNNADRETVKTCLEFYGLEQINEQNCLILQHEGPRFSFIQTEEDQRAVEIKDVKLLLQKHFLKWLLEISGKTVVNAYQDICSRYIVGLECTDDKCQDLHQPLQHFELRNILKSKIKLITICGLLLEAKKLSNEYSEKFNEIVNPYGFNCCNSLFNLVFSKHFHLRILSENSKMCREVLLKFPAPGKTMLNKFVESLLGEDKKHRRESTDLWLKIMQICSIISRYPEGLQRFLEEEERQFEKDYVIQKMNESRGEGSWRKYLEGRYGMLKPDTMSDSPKMTHIHFFRLLQNSLQQLYHNKNPDSCKRYFFRFMNLLVKKCVLPLIPNIGNTIMLLEFQFMLCCAVLMRFDKETRVVLPKSYISILHYWEYMFGNKVILKDTYSILWEYKPKDISQLTKNFRHHILYLAKVLSGHENEEFNVLVDAFNDVEYICSGEAERTLVFWLVMMVNLTGVISEWAKPMLTKYIPEVQSKLESLKNQFPMKVPRRLIDVVRKLSTTDTTEDQVLLLQELLTNRDDERLVECSWRWDIAYSRSGGVRGIFFDDKFQFRKLSYVHHSVHDIKVSSMVNEQEDIEEEKVDLVAALAADIQKQIAVRQLNILFLVACTCIKWKRAHRRMLECHVEEEESIPDNFKIANVDRTQCDLCGVKFLQARTLTGQGDDEDDLGDILRPTVEIDTPNLQVMKNEEYENHIVLEKHRKQINDYNKYLHFFKVEVDSTICKGKSLIQKMGQTSGNKLRSKEEFHLQQTKIEHKIKIIVGLMEEIYEKKTWSEAEHLMRDAVSGLTEIISESLKLLEKSEQTATRKEDLGFQEDCEIDYGDFDELCPKKPKRGKRKNKKR
ncbi:TPR and ankyrin repeat-containing protein 1 isoform X3 [Hyla sarda]|uniref:TPR and ankyrin repeat-containing protein 1 isoform X3 n=1 Tax=Hyla sarda TaxID=327740 RepID=UPI0024C339F4|nr:TPR and ankyrin repeat-containing protein 1 isoform X3 [Hyla sarda]